MKASSLVRAALIVCLGLSPGAADARFGKKSPDSGCEGDNCSPKKSRRRPPAPAPSQAHAASPVVASARPVYVTRHRPHVHVATPVYVPVYQDVYVEPAPQVRAAPRQERDEVEGRFELGLTGQVVGEGASTGVHLLVDGERFGFAGEATAFVLGSDDGSGGVDLVSLTHAHLTYSLLRSGHGRLRVHGGINAAFAPDIALVGPGMGLSATVIPFGGPFVMEASAQLTPFPFSQLDTRAGVGLEIGPLELRAGYRLTYLDDQGRVDGVTHADLFAGPYLGAGLVF